MEASTEMRIMDLAEICTADVLHFQASCDASLAFSLYLTTLPDADADNIA